MKYLIQPFCLILMILSLSGCSGSLLKTNAPFLLSKPAEDDEKEDKKDKEDKESVSESKVSGDDTQDVADQTALSEETNALVTAIGQETATQATIAAGAATGACGANTAVFGPGGGFIGCS